MENRPAPVVVRRRSGSTTDVRLQDGVTTGHRLETGGYRPMRQRLVTATSNLEAALTRDVWTTPFQGIEARDEQREALEGFLEYLKAVTDGLSARPFDPIMRGRLVAAARIGKTEMMIMLICATGARSVICVPSVALVEQTVARLKDKAPSINVGAYYGGAKEIVGNGVTVVTYQTLTAQAKSNSLPSSIKDVAFVFCDEGHETMTSNRQDSIGNTFDSQAVVVAFTATPDYNANKVLAVFYPYLIFELLMPEASTRGLLAPARFGFRVVDLDASKVSIRNGTYDETELDQVTANALVYEEARNVRFDLTSTDVAGRQVEHRTMGALMTCNSKHQARELQAFLVENRPAGSPEPAIVIDTTTPDERREAIEDFDAGKIDTLIIVRTLLRGWNAPRCKLLIDLSPSRSRVLCGQKFPRPLTKVDDQTGFIFVIYPYGLRPIPLLPSDILVGSFAGDDEGQRIQLELERGTKKTKPHVAQSDAESTTAPKVKKIRSSDVSVEKMVLRHVSMFTLKPPTFKADIYDEVRAVVLTNAEFVWDLRTGKRPARADFRQMIFDHDTFVGNGQSLLRYCRLSPGTINFNKWLLKFFPELKILEKDDEAEYLPIDESGDGSLVRIEFHGEMDDFEDPNDLALTLMGREIWKMVFDPKNHATLSERQRFILTERFEGKTWSEIGEVLGVTGSAVAQNAKRAIVSLRETLRINPYRSWEIGLD